MVFTCKSCSEAIIIRFGKNMLSAFSVSQHPIDLMTFIKIKVSFKGIR
jgi:hypothetical protein